MASDKCVPAEADLPSLVRNFSPLLYRVAYSMLRSAPEAEDVVQDVFLKVVERRGKIGEIRDLRVWLVRIAWNASLDRRRRIRPQQMDPRFAESLLGACVPADRALADASSIAKVLAEIDRLPVKEREVILLSAMEELGTAEMASVLGKTESATRALLFRARTRLKERLEKGGGL